MKVLIASLDFMNTDSKDICNILRFDTVTSNFKSKAIIESSSVEDISHSLVDIYINGEYDNLMIGKFGWALVLRVQLVKDFNKEGYVYSPDEGTVIKKDTIDSMLDNPEDILAKIIDKAWGALDVHNRQEKKSNTKTLDNISLEQVQKARLIADTIEILTRSGLNFDQAFDFIKNIK